MRIAPPAPERPSSTHNPNVANKARNMTYCPNSDKDWKTLSAQEAGFDQARLADAIAFAEAHESPWPRDLEKAGSGTHWGGGMQINSFDHARFGLLVHRDGLWNGRRYLPEGWTNSLRTPCPINAGYGYLWWLNTGKREWPAAPESSYAAVGAGTNIIWIDPDNDLVLVARWINQEKVSDLIGHFVGALG
jgi:CubicO group peptidase (beta-lactamase class C family)